MIETEERKWEFLRAAPARDAQDPELRDLVRSLWAASRGRVELFAELAHAVARDGIRQVEDSAQFGHEDIMGFTRPWGSALEALDRGADDCDAKARLFVALVTALASIREGTPISARMVPVWKNGQLAHVYAEVTIRERVYPVETILARARLGERASDVPVEKKTGKWLFT